MTKNTTTANTNTTKTINTTKAFEAYRRMDWESLRASFEEAAEAASGLWPGEEDYDVCNLLQHVAGSCHGAARDAFTEPGDSVESDHQNRLILQAMQALGALHDLQGPKRPLKCQKGVRTPKVRGLQGGIYAADGSPITNRSVRRERRRRARRNRARRRQQWLASMGIWPRARRIS
jgi:hypothetical protein